MGEPLLVLGVDPGTSHVGLTLIRISSDEELTWVDSCVLRPEDMTPSELVMYKASLDVQAVFVEKPEGRNGPAVKFIPDTALVAGEVCGICKTISLPVRYITARYWREKLCGVGSAKDSQVTESLMDIMELPKRTNPHKRDAAGVAIVGGLEMSRGISL